MPRPADELLLPNAVISPAWALFDAPWYLRTYPDAAHACAGDVAVALNYYLTIGGRAGHAPSMFFDETFYLARNPDIAALVRRGTYRSGFDHYCQHGYLALSPHYLFDDALYAAIYDDMTIENLARHNCYGRYDHYLKSGQRERRMAHFMFDAQYYRAAAIADNIAPETIDEVGPFSHYLRRVSEGEKEISPSVYFDAGWYKENAIGVQAALDEGVWRSALQHYLCNETPAAFDPVKEYSENFYLQTYPDVDHAVQSGYFRNGYQHFVQHGAFELRRPSAEIDLVYYRDVNSRVLTDLNTGAVRDAFAHLRLIGLKEGLRFCPPERVPDIDERAAKQLFILKARNALALYSHHRLDFTPRGVPQVAVVMVLHNKFELTMLALASLRDNYRDDIELIIVDNASTDDTRRIGTYVKGAHLIRAEANLGFLKACNLALEQAHAPALLYLNNDIELGHATLDLALARLQSDPLIGAVGGKVIRTHGRLQEAGSIIWADGTTSGYLRDASPLAPEANYVRDVDYCSGVFLLTRTDLVKSLGGFDEDFAPAYYEEVDLCVRMIEAGYRIVYDPAVVIHHLEFGSAANTEASMILMRRGRQVFERKHKAFLKTKFVQSPANLCQARGPNDAGRRILFLEDTVPVRRLGSGFVRANDAVRAMVKAGFQVSVLPVNGARHDIMSLFGDLPDNVEVLYDRTIMTLPALLAERPHYYDVIWISRTHNLDRTLEIFTAANIDPRSTAFILDTEAVVAGRQAHAAKLAGQDDFDIYAALRDEFRNAHVCRHVTAVNQMEVDLLRGIGLPAVSVLGTIREPAPTMRDFNDRTGLLFIASIHQYDSPNYDSLRWYIDEILPALAREMDEVPHLTFIGYTASDIDLSAFAGHPLIDIRGAVDDTMPAYDSHRLFIAPTRFAAGTPYKVYETASFGLPCVATALLAGQLGWQDGQELFAAPADAPAFAARIASLYRSEPLWHRVRQAALDRLAAENGTVMFDGVVKDILTGALSHRRRRPVLRAVT
ncbi:MAG TPA: glycosyltransferase [Acetobacteraceae bacterium]|nr:glycosyltransferase [Acetobacteraceae bacterium]